MRNPTTIDAKNGVFKFEYDINEKLFYIWYMNYVKGVSRLLNHRESERVLKAVPKTLLQLWKDNAEDDDLNWGYLTERDKDY